MAATQRIFSPSRLKDYWLEYVITGVFGALPTPLGSYIRNVSYQAIFEKMGRRVYIEPRTRLIGTKHIQIHDDVKIREGTLIQSGGNPIILKEGVSVGRFGTIRSFRNFEGEIEIGERTILGYYSYFAGPGSIKVGEDCMFACHTSVHANHHNFGALDVPIQKQGRTCQGITIEDNCWIGAGVRILDGVTIGRGTVIGAGAVVNQDLPPYSVAVGVPAKVVRCYGNLEQRNSGYNLLYSTDGDYADYESQDTELADIT